jgi:two-component system, NtrC family, nitrogen regulation sensor histidine kinase GlnL
VASEHSLPSPLSHFDSEDLLNALSTGIILLDAQLCPIYANVAAQDLLAISLNQSRGRPFGDHLLESNGLIPILRRSIETGEAFADRELVLNLKSSPREPRIVDVTITPLEGEVTGTHLLLELTDTTARQRISRENEMLVRLDSSRMMLRQLAGAAAGSRAAQRQSQGIHQRHHFRGRPLERAGGLDDRSESTDAEDAAQHP